MDDKWPSVGVPDQSGPLIPIPTKVCIAWENRAKCEINISVVDVNSDDNNSRNEIKLVPRVRLVGEYFKSACFCLLESTLYVFDGYSYQSYDSKSKAKCVYGYEIPSDVSDSVLALDKSMLVKVCSMNGYKYCPFATALPSGDKILVTSSMIDPPRGDKYCNFELFDPARRKCHKLPELFPLIYYSIIPPEKRACEIVYWTFISKSVLIVQTVDASLYTLDLREESGWNPRYRFTDSMGDPFEIIGIGEKGDLCLTPDLAYHIPDGIDANLKSPSLWHYSIPELSIPESKKWISPDVILLDISNPRDCRFCISHIAYEETHVVLDVYHCDVVECGNELTEIRQNLKIEDMWKRTPEMTMIPAFCLPGTSKLKALKFFIETQPLDTVSIIAVFAFPAELQASTIVLAEPRKEGRRRSARLMAQRK